VRSSGVEAGDEAAFPSKFFGANLVKIWVKFWADLCEIWANMDKMWAILGKLGKIWSKFE